MRVKAGNNQSADNFVVEFQGATLTEVGGKTTVLPAPDRTQIRITGEGLISETGQLATLISGTTSPTGDLLATTIGLRAGDVVNSLACDTIIAGAGTAPTLIKLALLDKTGKVLAQTANVNSNAQWTGAVGIVSFPVVTPVTITVDDVYYACILQSGAFSVTPVQVAKFTSHATLGSTVNSGARRAATQSGQTDLAATGLSQTLVAGSAPIWIGVY